MTKSRGADGSTTQFDLVMPLLQVIEREPGSRLDVASAVQRIVRDVEPDLIDYHYEALGAGETRTINWVKQAARKLRKERMLLPSASDRGFYVLTDFGKDVLRLYREGAVDELTIKGAANGSDARWLVILTTYGFRFTRDSATE